MGEILNESKKRPFNIERKTMNNSRKFPQFYVDHTRKISYKYDSKHPNEES